MSVTPRTRQNRMPRSRIEAASVGDESFPLTCPRCGWPCSSLHRPGWESPWTEHGGLCEECFTEGSRRIQERARAERHVEAGAKVGTERREQALEKVSGAADSEWKFAARAAVAKLAATGEPFISDDVWRLMPDGVQTGENRALGAVMMSAARRGLIEKTGRYLPSSRPELHRTPCAEWVGTGVEDV